MGLTDKLYKELRHRLLTSDSRMTTEFNTICEEYATLATQENELKDALKDVTGRKKELEGRIKLHMEENNILELPFLKFSIKMREKVMKKSAKKEYVIAALAHSLNISRQQVADIFDSLKSEERVRQVKAVPKA